MTEQGNKTLFVPGTFLQDSLTFAGKEGSLPVQWGTVRCSSRVISDLGSSRKKFGGTNALAYSTGEEKAL